MKKPEQVDLPLPPTRPPLALTNDPLWPTLWNSLKNGTRIPEAVLSAALGIRVPCVHCGKKLQPLRLSAHEWVLVVLACEECADTPEALEARNQFMESLNGPQRQSQRAERSFSESSPGQIQGMTLSASPSSWMHSTSGSRKVVPCPESGFTGKEFSDDSVNRVRSY